MVPMSSTCYWGLSRLRTQKSMKKSGFEVVWTPFPTPSFPSKTARKSEKSRFWTKKCIFRCLIGFVSWKWSERWFLTFFCLLMFKKSHGATKISKNTKIHILLPLLPIASIGTKNDEKSPNFDFRTQNHVCLQWDVLYYFWGFKFIFRLLRDSFSGLSTKKITKSRLETTKII